MKYIAFISYKHSNSSRKVASAIESSIKSYARSPLKRPPNIFRDEKFIVPNLDLPATIKQGIDSSEYLIFLAEPESAISKWCIEELEYWVKDLGRKDKMIFILLGGEISELEDTMKLNWNTTNALPAFLEGELSSIPYYLDFRELDQNELNLKNPPFTVAINSVVAKLRNVDPQDLNDENIKQVRRWNRLKNSAASLIFILLGLAAFLGWRFSKANKSALESNKRTISLQSDSIRLQSDLLATKDSVTYVDSLRIQELIAKEEAIKESLKQERLTLFEAEQKKKEQRKKLANFIASQSLNSEDNIYEAIDLAFKADSLDPGNALARISAVDAFMNKKHYRIIHKEIRDTLFEYSDKGVGVRVEDLPGTKIYIKDGQVLDTLDWSRCFTSKEVLKSYINESFSSYISVEGFSSDPDYFVFRIGGDLTFLVNVVTKEIIVLNILDIFDIAPIKAIESFYTRNIPYDSAYFYISDSAYIYNRMSRLFDSETKVINIPYGFSETTDDFDDPLVFETLKEILVYNPVHNVIDRYPTERLSSQLDIFDLRFDQRLLFLRSQNEHSSASGEVFMIDFIKGILNKIEIPKTRSFQPQDFEMSEDNNHAFIVVSDWEQYRKCFIYEYQFGEMHFKYGLRLDASQGVIGFSKYGNYLITSLEGKYIFYNILDEFTEFELELPRNLKGALDYDEYTERITLQSREGLITIELQNPIVRLENKGIPYFVGEFSPDEKYLLTTAILSITDSELGIALWDPISREIFYERNWCKSYDDIERGILITLDDEVVHIVNFDNLGVRRSEFIVPGIHEVLFATMDGFIYQDTSQSRILHYSISQKRSIFIDSIFTFYNSVNGEKQGIRKSSNSNSFAYLSRDRQIKILNERLESHTTIDLPSEAFYHWNDNPPTISQIYWDDGIGPMLTGLNSLQLSPSGKYLKYGLKQNEQKVYLYEIESNSQYDITDSSPYHLEWDSNDNLYSHGSKSFYNFKGKPLDNTYGNSDSSKNGGIRVRETGRSTDKRIFISDSINQLSTTFRIQNEFADLTNDPLISPFGNYVFIGSHSASYPAILIPLNVQTIRNILYKD